MDAITGFMCRILLRVIVSKVRVDGINAWWSDRFNYLSWTNIFIQAINGLPNVKQKEAGFLFRPFLARFFVCLFFYVKSAAWTNSFIYWRRSYTIQTSYCIQIMCLTVSEVKGRSAVVLSFSIIRVCFSSNTDFSPVVNDPVLMLKCSYLLTC